MVVTGDQVDQTTNPEESIFPRVTGTTITTFVNKTVILVGKVVAEQWQNIVADSGPCQAIVVQATDGVQVLVEKSEDSTYSTLYQEFVGHVKVDPSGQLYLLEFMARDVGEAIHEENYNNALSLLNDKFRRIYYGKTVP